MNARYYDPETGRFISQDTYRGEGEAFWHLYLYCNSDPVNNIDPTGHGKKYVLYYNGSSNLTQQAMHSPLFNWNNVTKFSFKIMKGFINAWNKMSGTIDYVYLFVHGDIGRLCFNDGTLYIGDLYDRLKKIKVYKTVFLLSCNGGSAPAGGNVAWILAQKTNSNVVACTGGVSYTYIKSERLYYPRISLKHPGVWKTFYYKNGVPKSYLGGMWI